MTALEAVHLRARRSPLLQRFTAFTRVLLALGFLPSGLKKVLGIPFTILPPETPVGSFFAAFFQAHEYYVFIGAAQLAAALLLLFPRTATLGAVIYFPIILNISVITFSMGFRGTWLVTLLMTLACLYLLCWDYHRLAAILPRRSPPGGRFGWGELAWQAGMWAAAGAGAYGFASLIGLANLEGALLGYPVGAAAGALFGLVLGWHLRLMPGPPEGAGEVAGRPEEGAGAPA